MAGVIGEAVMAIEFTAYKSNFAELARDRASLLTADKPYLVTVKRFYKPRSTGPESQNNHLWGDASQIGEYSGCTPREVLEQAIEDCLSRGYRTKDNFVGRTVPVAISEMDTNDASLVIERLHEIAAFLDVRLREE